MEKNKEFCQNSLLITENRYIANIHKNIQLYSDFH